MKPFLRGRDNAAHGYGREKATSESENGVWVAQPPKCGPYGYMTRVGS